VGDLYIKLKAFKSSLPSTNTFYFVKLDVQAAFDTIPQAAVLELVSKLPTEAEYRISKHVEIKPGEDFRFDANSRPRRKWTALARPLDDYQTFDEALESELAIGKKNTVFIENVVNGFRDSTEILTLLTEHIRQNIVKIGKKFYRQKEGIPQGSVLSSLLCNLFYADLEAQHLAFLQPEQSLLLRLIDDFLLITTNPQHAKQFLQVMHDGLPAYGVRVNPHKTLVNFEVTINDKKIERLIGNPGFPYCGNFIDMKTLNISKDRHRKQDMGMFYAYCFVFRRLG
jgi:telomerase reverse transcriptase